ncbi:hypothetical protein GCK72_006913 [Caenorhabditis remanei]|uniref:Peptidase M13 C-terminal domain-containing protein n=1 Tax=Caenorhabditis remanei TaxID=31234 RepID=A0A6A5HHJ4_CAERE|nr:hypothetical protein GCK72_006913 [Caenorhabditis remanei]KAF1766955.1 hypothetical protein GCK72_006913 [Caenorhabditis remanei]
MIVRKEIIFVVVVTALLVAVLLGTAIFELMREPMAVHVRAPEALVAPPSTKSLVVAPSTKSPVDKEKLENTSTKKMARTVPTKAPAVTKAPRTACETPQCMLLAHQLHNWRDPTVDPCNDFYQYACGRYLEHSDSTGGRNREKEDIIVNLLESFLKYDKSAGSKSENAMRHVYKKCQDFSDNFKKRIKINFKEMYQDILKIGTWPIMETNWDESNFDLNNRMTQMAKLHFSEFVFFTIGSATNKTIEIGYSQSKMFERDNLSGIRYFIKEICKVNHVSCDGKQLKKDQKDVEKLVGKLINVPQLKNPKYVPFETVKTKLKFFDIEKIVDPLMAPESYKSMKNHFVTQENTITLEEVEKIIQQTPKRTLANVLIFKYIEKYANYIEEDKKYAKSMDCVEHVNELFPRASMLLYVRKYYEKKNRDAVTDMVNPTRETYIQMFNESKLISQKTKERAILKLQKLRVNLGYPDEFNNQKNFEKNFESLNFEDTDSYYSSIKKIMKYQSELFVKYLVGDYPIRPHLKLNMVNAQYSLNENLLWMFVGYLEEPKFHWSYPTYAKFAGVGRIMGHEMGHGFDIRGIERDEIGHLNAIFDKEDAKNYKNRAKCLEKQYDNYDDPDYGRNLKGNMVIKEIMADRLGQEVAYRTYHKVMSQNEQYIIGSQNKTSDQMFFNLIALDYCRGRSTRPLERILQQSHPMANFRVNGNFQNLKYFADAYNCPVGSPMNPKKKCDLF